MEHIDQLTGLSFEAAFFSDAEDYLKTAGPDEYCMMAINIENFRLYNQIYGQARGDRLLSFLGDLLQAYVKEHGGIAGYLGRDNFALVTLADKESLKVFRRSVREEIRIQNKTTGYSPAFGVYTIRDNSESAASMYNHAMVALSHVIGNYTTDRCCDYYPGMDQTEEDIRLLSEIAEGIEKDEFTFYIQPQCDISMSKIVGGESLVRWVHKEKGLIPPGVFIPVMERNGCIADLDQVIWEKVCQWLRSCIDRGYKPVPVSVNVSRIDIFSLDVPKFFIELVEKYDITPDLLKIEITESAYTQDSDVVIKAVQELQNYGFVVMMDDFGSGYSSLNMLKSMPVDVLKMDMRFLEINENEEEKGISILESVINMARQMRIPIVVEGVETPGHESLLKKMGCCYTQGYLYYKPMPIGSFEEILADDTNLVHGGFWYKQAESVHLREFLDTNLFSDTVINNILGPVAFYEVVGDTVEIIRVNDQYFELAGSSRQDDDLQNHFWNSVRDDDRQLLYSIFHQAYENQTEGASGFINFIRRDGATLWVNIRVYFLREKEEHFLFYASFTDMTDKKAEISAPSVMSQHLEVFTETQRHHMEQYYGNIPVPFAVGKPILNDAGKAVDWELTYANEKLSGMCGGSLDRLYYLTSKLFRDKKCEFLDTAYGAAYLGEPGVLHVFSGISNKYLDVYLYPYQEGYACCMLQDATHSHIYERVSGNIMESFRAVYFLQLQENYCRMIFPDAEDMLSRGDYEEMIRRKFDNGEIGTYDEAGVREFLSLENLKKVLRKKDSVQYRYKRGVKPAGEEWCVATITVSERKDGLPKTATIMVHSIESQMREKESYLHENRAKILQSLSDGFFIYTAEEDEQILYANPAVLRMFGCKTYAEFKELTSNTFPGLVYPEDVKRVQWEIHSQVRETDRKMDYIRYRIMRKDGVVRWVDDVGHLETSEHMDDSKVFYVFISDVTDHLMEAEKNALIARSKRFS